MKKIIFIGIGLIVLVVASWIIYGIFTTRSHSPSDTAAFAKNDLTVTLNYCRPFKKGRLIFGSTEQGALVPYGEYWRTGANEATEIEFNKDIMFQNQAIKSGRYRLYTIPGETEWTVALNSELGKWGYYPPDYSKDIARIIINPSNSEIFHEQLTIAFSENGENMVDLIINWDNTEVRVPITY